MIAVSRVPWISYNWGPYGIGANVLWSPGDPAKGWAYSEDGIRACVDFAAKSGRKVAGLVITNPDNPTGLTMSAERQTHWPGPHSRRASRSCSSIGCTTT